MSSIKIVCPHCDNRFFREDELLQAGAQLDCPRCLVTLEIASTKPLRLHVAAPAAAEGADEEFWDEFDDDDAHAPRETRHARERERAEEDAPPRKREKHLHHRGDRRRSPAEDD